MRFLIVTGLSGAGKTQVLHFLEDMGYYCVDNMPPSLLSKFAEICYKSQGKINKVALGIDIRGREMFSEIFTELSSLKNYGYDYEILFMDASDEVLVKRYKESRRLHPLIRDDGRIIDGILAERQMLKELKERANHVIDTSDLLVRQLKDRIYSLFAEGVKESTITINIISFGFKFGIPMDSDLVFDVRFLPNPYYVEELKYLTGYDSEVRDYVLKFPQTQEFMTKLVDLINFLLPHYIEEGKNQLVISIGCTGGKHRSATIAIKLYEALKKSGYRVIISHRDIDKREA